MGGNSGGSRYRVRNPTKDVGSALFLGGRGRQYQGSKDTLRNHKPGCPAQHNTTLGTGIEAKPTQMRNLAFLIGKCN